MLPCGEGGAEAGVRSILRYRQMKWGSRFAAAFFFFQLAVAPAVAEVCDKEIGENWMPSQGAWWPMLQGPTFVFFGLAAVAGCISFALRMWRTCFVVAAAFLVKALLQIFSFPKENESIRASAYSEGCRSLSSDLFSLAVAGLIALALFFVAFRIRNGNPQERNRTISNGQ